MRHKLGAAPGEPGPIKTFQGIGYVLDVESAPPTRAPDQAGASDAVEPAPTMSGADASA